MVILWGLNCNNNAVLSFLWEGITDEKFVCEIYTVTCLLYLESLQFLPENWDFEGKKLMSKLKRGGRRYGRIKPRYKAFSDGLRKSMIWTFMTQRKSWVLWLTDPAGARFLHFTSLGGVKTSNAQVPCLPLCKAGPWFHVSVLYLLLVEGREANLLWWAVRDQTANIKAVGLTGSCCGLGLLLSLWPCSLLYLTDVAHCLHAPHLTPWNSSRVAVTRAMLLLCLSRLLWRNKGTYRWDMPSFLSPVITVRTMKAILQSYQNYCVILAQTNWWSCCLNQWYIALAVFNEMFL